MTVPNPGAPMAPPQPDRKPPLTAEAARRARRAGAVGGGLAWLGLGIAQACAVLLLVPLAIAAALRGIVGAWRGAPDLGDIGAQVLPWLGTPAAIALMIGIPLGVVVALLGLWISARMLRHPGIARPVGVTWAGFGISVAAAIVLGSLGSAIGTPFSGGLPFMGGGPGPGFDPPGFDPVDVDPGDIDPGDIDPGDFDPGVLLELADPGRLLGFAWPFVVIGAVLALVLQIVASLFAWWWMAHAMRPAATGAAAVPAAPAPATGATGATGPTGVAAAGEGEPGTARP